MPEFRNIGQEQAACVLTEWGGKVDTAPTVYLTDNATRLTDLVSGLGSTTVEEGEANPPPTVQETAWAPAKLIMDLCTGMSGGDKGEGKGPGPSSATKGGSDQTLLITNLGLDVEMSGATEGQGKGPGPPPGDKYGGRPKPPN